MMKDRTTTLLAAYRTLKAVFYLCFLPDDLIPIDDWHSWVTIRDSAIEEICYDIYDKILAPCLEDYKRGVHFSMAEQRMLAKIIQMIAEELDYCPFPWNSERREDKDFGLNLEQLNKFRQDLITLVDTLDVKTIKQFVNKAGAFIKCIAPKTVFLKHKIIFHVYVPEDTVYELTLNEDRGQLNVSPIVSGSFFYHLGPKKVNIETGEIINKVKYDLHNYTIDLTSIN